MSAEWTITEGDAVAALEAVDEGSVDAIVTDPPYCSGAVREAGRRAAIGQGLRSETLRSGGWFTSDNMSTAGLAHLLRSVGFEAARVLVGGGSLIVFCDWRMSPIIAPAIESGGLRFQNLLVWDKRCMGLGVGFRMQHELALHYCNGTGRFYARDVGNVLSCDRVDRIDRDHPAEKPVDLLRTMIRVVAPPLGLVVDPFCGSGSTGVAALREGRRFLGVDRDADHVQTARGRLSSAMQLGFADAAPPGETAITSEVRLTAI